MSYWRKLFIVVLLALSLPVQSFAAVSMKCVFDDADAGQAPLGYAEHDVSAHHRALRAVALVHDDDHDRPGDGCHRHLCASCECSCCSAIALPTVPSVAMTLDATRVITSVAAAVLTVSFLTGGVERPPRHTLA